jgi:hypothetical protein
MARQDRMTSGISSMLPGVTDVVGQIAHDPVLGFETSEHLAEPLPIGVQVCFAAGLGYAATPHHGGVEVPSEGKGGEAGPPVGADGDRLEVLVVEVAVGEAHGNPPGGVHRSERGGVVVGGEQGDLTADELRVLAQSPLPEQVGHLPGDLGDGVGAVDGDLVGVGRVVAGLAGEVALGEHAVRTLAAVRPPPEQLRRGLDRFGQRRPAPGQRRCRLGVDRPGPSLERPQGGDGMAR